jgi:hypothetical protein
MLHGLRRASAFALAGVLAGATVVAALTVSVAFTGIEAFAGVFVDFGGLPLRHFDDGRLAVVGGARSVCSEKRGAGGHTGKNSTEDEVASEITSIHLG